MTSTAYLATAPLRRKVFARDRGVCALCGWDTVALGEALEAHAQALARHGAELGRIIDRSRHADHEVRGWLRAIGFRGRRWLWEVDHLLPQAWGRRNELSNLRTLCVPCHVLHSKAQRRVLAKAARLAREAEALKARLANKVLDGAVVKPERPVWVERQNARRRERDRSLRARRKAQLRERSEQILAGQDARPSMATDRRTHAEEDIGHGRDAKAQPRGENVHAC